VSIDHDVEATFFPVPPIIPEIWLGYGLFWGDFRLYKVAKSEWEILEAEREMRALEILGTMQERDEDELRMFKPWFLQLPWLMPDPWYNYSRFEEFVEEKMVGWPRMLLIGER
jgi:hypothetical protein